MSLRRLRGRFKYRLFFTILGVVLICQAIAFFAVYQMLIRVMEDENKRTTLQSFTHVENSIDWVLEYALSVSHIIQRQEVFQAFINREYTTKREQIHMNIELAAEIDAVLGTQNILNAVLLFRGDGQIAGSSPPRRYFTYNPSHPFFFSETYNFLAENPTTVTWATDQLRWFYSQSTPAISITQRCIIIGVTRVVAASNTYGNIHPVTVLMVSVEERALRRFYEQLLTEGSSIVLLNEAGQLFSGMPMSEFATVPAFFEYMTGTYGSFILEGAEMIIYQQMASTGWYMVKTVPIWVYEMELRSTITRVFTVVAVALFVLLAAITSPVYYITRREIRQVESEKARLEIENLQNQLRPHFLYNTITAIRWMASLQGAHRAADSLVILVRLLRSVYETNVVVWTIEEELEFLQDYCDLMRMRYCEEVIFETFVEADGILIPRFILQPILENCFEHGLAGKDSMRITVTASKEGPKTTILISDDGVGIDEQRINEITQAFEQSSDSLVSGKNPRRKSVGLLNSRNRLKAVFGEESVCTIDNRAKGGVNVLLEYYHKL